METAEFKELLNRYREGKATAGEVAWLESWYMDLGKADQVVMDEAELNEAHKLIWGQFTAEHQVISIKRRLWPRIAVAAAAVAAITIGTWIYMNEVASSRKAPRNDVARNDIAPGKNGATITLANGKVIELSDAKSGVVVGSVLKYSDGSDVRYSAGSSRGELGTGGSSGSLKGSQSSTGPVGQRTLSPSELQGADGKAQQLTASTAKGQTYQFTLPDGTKVWLNADSKLEFPSSFVSSKTRNVKLSGEGYFEVSKDKTHPFIVATDKQEVEVLGTHFNINSYADETSVKTTLLEGSVRVLSSSANSKYPDLLRRAREKLGSSYPGNDKGGEKSIVLKPNQQSIVTGSDRIKLENIDPESAVAWKNGEFMFNDEQLNSIMRKVSRWYNVEVVYKDSQIGGKIFGGTISRFGNVSDVLRMLELTGEVHFKIEERRIVVTK